MTVRLPWASQPKVGARQAAINHSRLLQDDQIVKRQPISTAEELGGYLKRLAWNRYRARDFEPLQSLRINADQILTPPQVRSAIAAADRTLRWRFLEQRRHYDDQVLR
jgi:hypothetical protein